MKKLHAFAFYALVTPLTFGAGSLLAQSTDQDMDREQQSTEYDQDATQSSPSTTQNDQSGPYPSLSDAPTAADRDMEREQYGKKIGHDLKSAVAKGMRASELIGADVKTTDDESVGPVEELLIDKSGQVVAVVVGVGGFLGIGEKNVAIVWDEVTISGGTSDSEEHDLGAEDHDSDSEEHMFSSDELDLRIDLTREDLTSAPEFEDRD